MNPKKWSRKAQIIVGSIAALFIVAGIAGKEPEPTTASAEAPVEVTVAPTVPPATEAPTTVPETVATTVPATTAVPVTTQAPTTVPATTQAPTTTTEVPVTTPATTEAPTTTSSVDIPGLAAQMTWDGLSVSEQSDICDGYGLFGSDWVYNSLLEGITGGGEPSTDDKILGLALVDVIQKEC